MKRKTYKIDGGFGQEGFENPIIQLGEQFVKANQKFPKEQS